MPQNMKRALITGGSGFLGKAMMQHLVENDYVVHTFDTKPSKDEKHIQGDIRNYKDVKSALSGMDVVFHLAGVLGTTELLEQNELAIDVNIKGTVNVLEASLTQNVSTVFIPTKPDRWLNTYTITKKAAEEFAQIYSQIKGLDVRILRWLNAYGPGQKAFPVRKAVPIMIIQALENQDVKIWGDGEQKVFLNYTKDLARNTVLYTLKPNIDCIVRDTGNIVEMTVNELAQLIVKLSNSKSKITNHPMRLGEDPSKKLELFSEPTAADILGVTNDTTPIEEGMSSTIQYYKELPSQSRIDALEFYGNKS